jgi:hypothetical protein
MTKAFSATALTPPTINGVRVTPSQVVSIIEDNLKSGLAYPLVTEGLLELRILYRVVVPVLAGYIAPFSLFGAPKATIRCGSCGRSSKGRLAPLTIDGVRQQSSIIYCEVCGTANIANVSLTNN